jgi:L-rhamnose isomerase
MGMLNFFQNVADKMRKEKSEVDKRMDAYDEKYGTNALGFIQDQFQPAQTAEMIDSASLMAQTNNAAGIANPAASLLQSNATAAQATTPALYDPRSNNKRAGLLEDPDAETEQERLLRESYEGVQDYPLMYNNDVQPYGADQPLKVYG